MPIKKQDVIDIANSLIRSRCNSGISWGSNNYPANSLAGWFGGTTGGIIDSAPAPGNASPNAADVVATLTSYAQRFAGIRLVHIVITKSMNGYNPAKWNTNYYAAWTQTLVDQTAVAFTAYPSGAPSAAGTTLLKGSLLTLDKVTDACNRLYNTYAANSRSGALLLTNNICHYNCHSNCHNSRHRR